MLVLTIDQRGSTGSPDLVPGLLERLDDLTRGRVGLVLGFDRTVGDEVQGLLDDPILAVDVAVEALRLGDWSVGIGTGAVERPLPGSSREAAGMAFVRARNAVERAKRRTARVPLAVEGPDEGSAGRAEAVLRLIGAVLERRTTQAWEAIDALSVGAARKDVARDLGITEQALSARLRNGLYQEAEAATECAAWLLGEADL